MTGRELGDGHGLHEESIARLLVERAKVLLGWALQGRDTGAFQVFMGPVSGTYWGKGLGVLWPGVCRVGSGVATWQCDGREETKSPRGNEPTLHSESLLNSAGLILSSAY